MHPADCPDFDYANHRRHREILADRTAAIVKALRRRTIDTLVACQDSRSIHAHLFSDLTPPECGYFAGHYRGEDFRCLKFYRVIVPGDPRVGSMPESVGVEMVSIATTIREAIEALDSLHRDRHVTPSDRLVTAVKVACSTLEAVLRVHPYANGNGHACRFIVWATLGRYGYWPRNWPIEPRPPDPPYTAAIVQYRNGDPVPLEEFVLTNLVPS